MDGKLLSPSSAASPGAMQICNLCQKPFLNQSSYNRHVLYCRRARNRPRARIRSCQACTKSKRKCSGQLQCNRCTNKGLSCVYDVNKPIISASPRNNDESHSAENVAPSAIGPPIEATKEETCGGIGMADTFSEQASIDWDDFDLQECDMFLQAPNFTVSSDSYHNHELSPTVIHEGSSHTQSADNVLDIGSSSSISENVLKPEKLPWCAESQNGLENSTLMGPKHNKEQLGCGFLTPILMSNPAAKFTANIIMRMLCAFPQMMVRRETFPPFIHGHWFHASISTAPSLPKPLVKCMGLSQVFVSHNTDTRSFLWDMVREEQRLAADMAFRGEFSKEDHLATIQALLVYIMMRVVDRSQTETNLNLELLVTYQGLCDSFKNLCNESFYHHERLRPSSSWEEWVFAESRRRTAIVWLLITQMVHIKIGVPCDSFASFRDVPLSSPKMLWEAKTRLEWEKEYNVYKAMPRMGLDVFGDLYDVCKQSDTISNQMKLHAWNATVDTLGGLLHLGAEIM